MNREKQLFQVINEFVPFAGKLALPFAGNILAQSKKITIHGNTKENVVTAIDHSIQELLLARLIQEKMNNYSFNGEEKTHLTFLFPKDYEKGITIHCDPIDGTASFVTGKNRFAVGVGLSTAKKGMHDFFATSIYSPMEKKWYWSYRTEKCSEKKEKNPPRILASKYFNEDGRNRLKKMGYSFIHPGSGHLGVIDTILGKIGGITGDDLPVHDALIPFSFGKTHNVFPVDLDGKVLKKFKIEYGSNGFPNIPKIFYFANNQIRDEVLPLIQNPKYTRFFAEKKMRKE